MIICYLLAYTPEVVDSNQVVNSTLPLVFSYLPFSKYVTFLKQRALPACAYINNKLRETSITRRSSRYPPIRLDRGLARR